jgi:hypothetical protein
MAHKSFEQYLNDAYDDQVVDFRMRVQIREDGHPVFYIHPLNTGGVTADFVAVRDNVFEWKWPEPPAKALKPPVAPRVLLGKPHDDEQGPEKAAA